MVVRPMTEIMVNRILRVAKKEMMKDQVQARITTKAIPAPIMLPVTADVRYIF